MFWLLSGFFDIILNSTFALQIVKSLVIVDFSFVEKTSQMSLTNSQLSLTQKILLKRNFFKKSWFNMQLYLNLPWSALNTTVRGATFVFCSILQWGMWLLSAKIFAGLWLPERNENCGALHRVADKMAQTITLILNTLYNFTYFGAH